MAQRELRRVLLREGDRVAVVATGFAVRRAALQSGLSRLAAMGLETRLGTSVLARAAYFAGTDDRRLSDLRAALLGGASASPKLLRRAQGRRMPVVLTYGLTETCSQVAATPYAARFAPADQAAPAFRSPESTCASTTVISRCADPC